MQIFMYSDIAIWQFGVLIIYEESGTQEHSICKSRTDADNLFTHLMAKAYDTK